MVYRRIAEYGIVFRRKRYHQPYVVLVGKIGQRLDVLLVQRAEDNIHVLHLAFAEYGVQGGCGRTGTVSIKVYGSACALQAVYRHKESFVIFHHFGRLAFACPVGQERKDYGSLDDIDALAAFGVFTEQFAVARCSLPGCILLRCRRRGRIGDTEERTFLYLVLAPQFGIGGYEFGFGNYVKAFQNEGFLHSFWFTVVFVIVSVILINLIAFFVAYALTLGIRGSNVFRTVFFVPNLVGGIILGYIWQYIFNGILQYYGTNLALNANYGFWGLVILMCWQQAGYMMIIYIAGFQSVPHDLYEAAKIDGAGKKQLLTNVTLPMMMPSITICTFLTLTNSFKLFDQNLALTGGAPGIVSQGSGTMVYQTEMMALNIYNTFYANQNSRGVGQAEGVIFFVIVVIIALIQLYFTRRKEVQQ